MMVGEEFSIDQAKSDSLSEVKSIGRGAESGYQTRPDRLGALADQSNMCQALKKDEFWVYLITNSSPTLLLILENCCGYSRFPV